MLVTCPNPQQDIGGIPCIDFANGAELAEPVDNPVARAGGGAFSRAPSPDIRAEADGWGASERDLAGLNRILSQGQNHRGVLPAVRGYGWGWIGPAKDLDRVAVAGGLVSSVSAHGS